ncbi:hypothetical protein M0805_003205 [Coniferiporia weirii]|nr:hypothetical protein M0805_003205 [Coniferiporia weirii]
MSDLFRTTTILRRYSPSLLVLLIPLSLLLYVSFGYLSVWAFDSIVPTAPFISYPQTQDAVLNGTASGEILLVSAFFPLSKSKHSMRQYSDWLSHFLQSITTDIYFFTTPDLEKTIREIRGALPVTIDTRFSTAFDIPPLSGLEKVYEKMHDQDREREYHSPELYAVWTAKPFLLAEALRMLPENKYTYAFWTDAGSFRSRHSYAAWPDLRRVKEVWEGGRASGSEAEDLIFFPIQNPPDASMALWDENLGPIDNDFSEGSFFGGQLKAVFWWEKYYYAYHGSYLARHIFVGKDQTLMNSLFMLHPERVITVWYKDPDAPAAAHTRPSASLSGKSSLMLGDCGDPWYYYQFFLASAEEQTASRSLWDAEWHYDVWNIERWTHTQASCRATRVLAMESVLRRVFGDAWTPPHATIQF